MVDKGFTTYDLSFHRHVILYIHAFMNKINFKDVATTRRIARVKMHVERIIPRHQYCLCSISQFES
jgi:hypothetical protein